MCRKDVENSLHLLFLCPLVVGVLSLIPPMLFGSFLKHVQMPFSSWFKRLSVVRLGPLVQSGGGYHLELRAERSKRIFQGEDISYKTFWDLVREHSSLLSTLHKDFCNYDFVQVFPIGSFSNLGLLG